MRIHHFLNSLGGDDAAVPCVGVDQSKITDEIDQPGHAPCLRIHYLAGRLLDEVCFTTGNSNAVPNVVDGLRYIQRSQMIGR